MRDKGLFYWLIRDRGHRDCQVIELELVVQTLIKNNYLNFSGDHIVAVDKPMLDQH